MNNPRLFAVNAFGIDSKKTGEVSLIHFLPWVKTQGNSKQ